MPDRTPTHLSARTRSRVAQRRFISVRGRHTGHAEALMDECVLFLEYGLFNSHDQKEAVRSNRCNASVQLSARARTTRIRHELPRFREMIRVIFGIPALESSFEEIFSQIPRIGKL